MNAKFDRVWRKANLSYCIVLYGMVWYGMVWYGMVLLLLLLLRPDMVS